MFGFLDSWDLLDQLYLVCAAVGGLLFVFRTAMMLMGAEFDHDVDAPHDLDVHADTDADFKILSIQGIVGCVMMFGLVGLFLKKGLPLGAFLSLGGAIAAGGFTLWAIAKTMAWMKNLESSGNLDEKNAIGCEGTVYLTIPAGGVGKVQITMQDRLVEYDAESNDDEEIKTGARIRVVFLKGTNLIVEKV